MTSDALRPIFANRPEEAADAALCGVVAANGDRLHTKVAFSEILNVDDPDLQFVADKRFMLMASFDFVVTRHNIPIFAVEIDGAAHARDPKVRLRDCKKDAACERAGLPLLRVSSNLALRHGSR